MDTEFFLSNWQGFASKLIVKHRDRFVLFGSGTPPTKCLFVWGPAICERSFRD